MLGTDFRLACPCCSWEFYRPPMFVQQPSTFSATFVNDPRECRRVANAPPRQQGATLVRSQCSVGCSRSKWGTPLYIMAWAKNSQDGK